MAVHSGLCCSAAMRRLGIVLAALLLALVALMLPARSHGVIDQGYGAKRPILYVSPSGSDSGKCTKHAPCRSFARAFKVASGGSVVHVGSGDYKSSCAALRGSKSAYVTFVGSRDARVFCQLAFLGAHHVAVRGLKLYRIHIEASSDLRFQNLAVTCVDRAPYRLYRPANLCDATISLENSNDLLFKRMVIGPTYDSAVCGGDRSNFASGVEHVIFASVTFRDDRWQAAPCGGPNGSGVAHAENFYFSGLGRPARDITFDSCRFTNGSASGKVVAGSHADGSGPDSASLFLTGAFDHLIVRNCVFDGADRGPAINGAVDARISDSLFENNTWTNSAAFEYPSYPSLRFVNNLGAQQGCPISSGLGSSGGIFNDNLWYYQGSGGSADRCGKTDITVSGPKAVNRIFADFSTGNLHLKRGSPAIGRGDPTMYPARDHAGVRRPQGRRPDIGAFEFKVKQKHK